MAAEKDVLIYRLKNAVHDLKAENAELKRNRNIARKNEFRDTGIVLVVIGTIISLVAYPAYSYSNIASVLVMVGIASILGGTATMFLNTEKFVNQQVAEHLELSSVIVLDDLMRDMRIKNKGVYIPSSKTAGPIKVFVPLRRAFVIPREALLKEDGAFLIGLKNPSEEGLLLTPLGYHLFQYAREDLKVDWEAQLIERRALQEDTYKNAPKGHLKDTLKEVLVDALEIAEKVDVSLDEGTFEIRLRDTPYFTMCESLSREAPQVCAQLGCPLCSLVACIYTEYVDGEIVIARAEGDKGDIVVRCETLATYASRKTLMDKPKIDATVS